MTPPFPTKQGLPEFEGWACIADNIVIERGDIYMKFCLGSSHTTIDTAYAIGNDGSYRDYTPISLWGNISCKDTGIYRRIPGYKKDVYTSRRSPIPLNANFSARLPLP